MKNVKRIKYNSEMFKNVCRLRSEIYTGLKYNNEFKITNGLMVDEYDKKSSIFVHTNGEKLIGSTRLVLDSKLKLPTEKYYSFDNFRNKGYKIAEGSRLIVDKSIKESKFSFKYLSGEMIKYAKDKNIDYILATISKEHFKFYKKFGGVEIINDYKKYGNIEKDFITISIDLNNLSPFLNKKFLNIKD